MRDLGQPGRTGWGGSGLSSARSFRRGWARGLDGVTGTRDVGMGGGERTQGSLLPFQSKGVPDRMVEVEIRDGLGGGEVEVGGLVEEVLALKADPDRVERLATERDPPA